MDQKFGWKITTNNLKMNAIICARVSTTEQAELSYSLKEQEEICLDCAKIFRYDVIKIFKEKGESVKATNRIKYQKMLTFIKENKNNINV